MEALDFFNFCSSKPLIGIGIGIRIRIRIYIDLECWIRIRIETQCGSKTQASVPDADPLVLGPPRSGCVIICKVRIRIQILPSIIKKSIKTLI
jgi:hypothetical protein